MNNVTTTFAVIASVLMFSFNVYAGGNDGIEPGGTQQDTLNQYNEDGKKVGYWIVRGSMKPEMTDYAAEGKIEEGGYSTGRRSGLWKKYWPNQNLKAEITYRNGRPYGAYKTYYENGNREEEGNWAGRKQTGSFQRDHANGNPQQRFTFNEDGKRDGTQEYYDEKGTLILKVDIVEGKENGVMERYWPDGTLRERVVYNDGVADESTRETYESKEPVEEPVVEAISEEEAPEVTKTNLKTNVGKLNCNGPNKLYNRNRQIEQDGVFKNCRMWKGKIYKYNSDGLLVDVEIWDNGVMIGHGVIEEDETP